MQAATCAGGVFSWSTSAFTKVRTNEWAKIATCTVWWWLLYFYVVVMIVCVGGCMFWQWLYMKVLVIPMCGSGGITV